MRRRYKTFATGLVLAISAATGSLVLSSGTAIAAEPVVIGSCSTTVEGAPGTPVSLQVSAVTKPIMDIVGPIDLLGVGAALAKLPPIQIGVIPTGTGTISGSTIAKAVTSQLPLGALLTPVTNTLTSLCGVTTKGVNAVVAPVQDGAKVVAGAVEQGVAALPLPGNPTNPTQPPGTTNPGAGGGTGGTPGGSNGTSPLPGANQPVVGGVPSGGGLSFGAGGYNFGRAPMADYSNLPFAKAGLFSPSPGVRYGGGVPGYSPQFGILGANNDTDGVQAAGHADALMPLGGNRIAFPILLAVLALSGVTAALVRTWVLRRMTA